MDHLRNEGSPCPKYGIDQVKGSKDILRTTHWAEKIGLILTFEYMTCKQEGSSTHSGQPLHQIWYWSSDGVKRNWADNTCSTDRQTDIPTDRPTDSCKTICPLFHVLTSLNQLFVTWQISITNTDCRFQKSKKCKDILFLN